MFSQCKRVVGGLFALFAFLSLLTACPATAQTYSGTTAGGPTFNRPNGGNPPISLSAMGTATRYHTFNFTPTQTAQYKIVATTQAPTWDNFIAIYEGSFNPAAGQGLVNCRAANDDFGNSTSAGIDGIPLTGGQTYVIVVCGFGNGASGAFETVITQLAPTTATTGQPTFRRPNSNGSNPPTTLNSLTTAVPYNTLSFTPTVSGLYRFVSTSATPGFDNFTVLYQNSFDPTNPLTNALVANENFGSTSISGFEANLTFGTTYIFVTTGSVMDDYGVYSTSIQPIYIANANDSTQPNGPRYHRPNAGNPPSLPLADSGNNVPYRVLKVRVAASGNYNFTITRVTSTYDPFTSLYSGNFNPNAPINNIIIANDDKIANNTPTSGFDNVPLLTGVDYYLVVAGFENDDFGDFTVEIRSTDGLASILRFISGTVTREDCLGIPFEATFTLRPPDNSGDIVRTASVDADGHFTLEDVPSLSYQVKVKNVGTLSDVVQTSVVNGDVVGLVLGPLKGGDSNDDNAVDVFDLDPLIQAFNTCLGDEGYDAHADFNCDDCVDVFDLDVLIRNFNQTGEDFS